MKAYEEDLRYQKIMDRISEQIEELMLDVMIEALKNIKDRNLFYSDIQTRPKNDPIPF